MENYLRDIKNINTINGAIECLAQQIEISPLIKECIDFTIFAHEGQKRKSGEPYVVHPILVASIAAYNSKNETMVLGALLHDVVEDTRFTLEIIEQKFGQNVARLVDGLTKITEIRDNEFHYLEKNETVIKSALTFRKMLMASIEDAKVLTIKLFDRMHNMLTLDALPQQKQIKISEETLLVYAPIAHKLGISTIKNCLEDIAFSYIYPEEYNKIDRFIKEKQETLLAPVEDFVEELKIMLDVENNDIQIVSRVKHYYSIYLKTQRKGINLDEVLDLYALRIITKNTLDCYTILGKIHTSYHPLISRFKDYISIPKENGYQTIHTTVFRKTKIYEIQIRTLNMNKIAEYGVAAHWKYKNSVQGLMEPSLNWLEKLEVDNKNVEEFYKETKEELFSEEIIVYSPSGELFRMPKSSIAYDFAFLIHTDIGHKAVDCFINTTKKSLLTELKSGDIISIRTQETVVPRCSWINIVKTSKAKKALRILCQNRDKIIDKINGQNIVNTCFLKYNKAILDEYPIKNIAKVAYNLDHFKNVIKILRTHVIKDTNIFKRLAVSQIRKLKEYKLDNFLVYSNVSINSFAMDHCCHPKLNDDIVGFRVGKCINIHHKMCDSAYSKMINKNPMVFVKWSENQYFTYRSVVSIPNIVGELARLLTHMSKNGASILFIEYGKDKHSEVQYCTIDFEIKNKNHEQVSKILAYKSKVIEFYSKDDAYNKG